MILRNTHISITKIFPIKFDNMLSGGGGGVVSNRDKISDKGLGGDKGVVGVGGGVSDTGGISDRGWDI